MGKTVRVPLWGVRGDGSCECPKGSACGNSAGKHTSLVTTKGVDPDWRPAEGQGYGILTGEVSGLVVVDIDEKDGKNGLEALKKWSQKFGEWPETLTVRTPSGGLHWYFQHPGFPVGNSQGWPAAGVDLRGEGGLIVGPGTRMPSGTYEVVNAVRPAILPPWFLTQILERSAGRKKAPRPFTSSPEQRPRNVIRGQGLAKSWRPAVSGQGGSVDTYVLAGKLRRELALSFEDTLAIMLEVYNPRCAPPWSQAELEHKIRDAEERLDWEYCPDVFTEPSRPVVVAPSAPSTRVRPVDGHTPKWTLEAVNMSGQRKKMPFDELIGYFRTSPDWAGRVQWNEFRRRVEIVDPPIRMEDVESGGGLSDTDVSKVRFMLGANGHTASKLDIWEALNSVSRENSYHPVREWLSELPVLDPNGPGNLLSRLSSLVFGTTDPRCDAMLRKFLIGAVRRILQPGVQLDTMLVLHGGQGVGKSRFIRQLFAPWYRLNLPNIREKDSCDAIRGVWVVEVGELDQFLRHDPQTAKDFLSRTVDAYRPPYERGTVEAPRQVVFIGTTNDDDFLKDATGDRRYWPIAVPGKINLEWLEANREAIWAEAYAAALTDEKHYFEGEEEADLERVRRPFQDLDPWTGTVEDWLRGKLEVRRTSDVFTQALHGDVGHMTKREANRIGAVLRRLGCTPQTRRVGAGTEKYWEVPPHLSQDGPAPKKDPEGWEPPN